MTDLECKLHAISNYNDLSTVYLTGFILSQVHKAQPIRHYKPVELKQSEVSLTVPQSPNFSDRFRL